MRLLIASLIASAFVFTACGGAGGQSSPEAVAEAASDKLTDPEGLATLFPTAEQINEAMDCEGENKFAAYVSKKRTRATKEATKMAKEELSIEFVKAELVGESKLSVKAGDKKDGCTFKTDVEVKNVKMHFKFSKDGKEEAESETITVARLGDVWYLTKL